MGYSVGEDVELSFLVGSTRSTDLTSVVTHLVVTDPEGTDQKFTSTQLAATTPSSASTSEGWRRWTKVVPMTLPGRWTYQFTSTGLIRTSAGGACAVARPLASTST